MAAKEYSLDILDARIDINAAIIVAQRADRRSNRYHPIRSLSVPAWQTLSFREAAKVV